MRFLDLSLPTIEENLALDEALLAQVNDHGDQTEVLRFWESSSYAVVLGAASRVAEDVVIDACRRDAVPVVRRTSGGGCVLVGPGCLSVALCLRYERSKELKTVGGAYHYVLPRMCQALHHSKPHLLVRPQGLGDLCLLERKVGGSAQRRRRDALLYHATLLYGFDIGLMARYLAEPVRQPAYRRGRSHACFMTNAPVELATLKTQLCGVWEAHQPLQELPTAIVAQLVAEKLTDDRWTYRR